MDHRDIDTIKRDLLIAQLKAANVRLQVELNQASAAALNLEAEKVAGFMQKHAADVKLFDDELRAAMAAKGEQAPLGGQVIPITPPVAAEA